MAGETRPVPSMFRRRLMRVWIEWPTACTLCCEILMVFFGLAFLVNPLHRTVQPGSPWHDWGVSGLVVLGVAFTGVGTYAALYRERMAGLVPTFLFVGIALPGAVADLNVLGIIFYGLFLIGGFEEARTRYDRAKLRKEWTIHVSRGAP
jgi:hypothetical protein